MGSGIWGAKISGIWDLDVKKSGIWDLAKLCGIWDLGYIKKIFYLQGHFRGNLWYFRRAASGANTFTLSIWKKGYKYCDLGSSH